MLILDDKIMEADSICGLGTVYQQMGEYTTALRYHQNDLDIAEQLGMPVLQSRAYGNLGKSKRYPTTHPLIFLHRCGARSSW